MIFFNEIQDLISRLKAAPNITDQVFYVDSLKEPLLEGPNDLFNIAFWISRVPGNDVIMIPIRNRPQHYVATGQFQIIGSCRQCNREDLVRFILFHVGKGCSAGTVLSWNDDSQAVYQEVTGEPLQWEVKFVRVRLSIRTYLYLGDCEPDLCQAIECLNEY